MTTVAMSAVLRREALERRAMDWLVVEGTPFARQVIDELHRVFGVDVHGNPVHAHAMTELRECAVSGDTPSRQVLVDLGCDAA
jgi:hypothetical protein